MKDFLDISLIKQLIAKRQAGANNIKGIIFQIHYSTYRILQHFSDSDEQCTIQLEGLEDIDMRFTIEESEYVQVKHSKNKIDAYSFWQKGILQHFLDVYLSSNANCHFCLAYNMPIAKGYLESLFADDMDTASFNYWNNKLLEEVRSRSIEHFNTQQFLKQICYERTTFEEQREYGKRLLLEFYGINTQNEDFYFQSLMISVFFWANTRKIITKSDLLNTIEAITDNISKSFENNVLLQRWIERISFPDTTHKEAADYLEGKAARPYHIAADIPIRRAALEEEVHRSLDKNDVCVIKGLSGQGKSTLLWQVCFSLVKKGYVIYQLHNCDHEDKLGGLIHFCESRVRMLEQPVVVIDGVNKEVRYWILLANRLNLWPVKFIITCSQKDWHRLQCERTRLRIATVDVMLTSAEAKALFQLLVKNGKIFLENTSWKVAWEKVADSGLLMEYMYLLTHGNLMEERLLQQIQKLGDQTDGAIKMAVVRTIAVADICQAKISKSRLVNYIATKYTLATDADNLLQQLSSEYFINDDGFYIKGLHVVRSQHLVNILHQVLNIQQSYLEVFLLLDQKFLFDFFANAPFNCAIFLEKEFLITLKEGIRKRPPEEIVEVLDGLYANMAKYYRLDNEKVFNSFRKNHAWLQLIADTQPGYGPEQLNYIAAAFPGITSLINEVRSSYEDLPGINIRKTIIGELSKEVLEGIKTGEIDLRHEGGFNLLQWITKSYSLTLLTGLAIDGTELLSALHDGNMALANSLAYIFHLRSQREYYRFSFGNEELLHALKSRLNAAYIKLDKTQIEIGFIADTFEEIGLRTKVVTLICQLYCFYPYLESFKAVPLLNTQLERKVHKLIAATFSTTVSRENVIQSNLFTLRLTDIWKQAIQSGYEYSTMFEWLKKWLMRRIEALDIIISLATGIEAGIKGDMEDFVEQMHCFVEDMNSYTDTDFSILEFPGNSIKKELQAPLETINKWDQSLTITINTLIDVLKLTHVDLFLSSIKELFRCLPSMQESFRKIFSKADITLDIADIERGELEWYEKFHHGLIYVFRERKTFLHPRNLHLPIEAMIHEVYVQEKAIHSSQVREIIHSFATKTGYDISITEPSGERCDTLVLFVDGTILENFDQFAQKVLFNIISIPTLCLVNMSLMLTENKIPLLEYVIDLRRLSLTSHLSAISNADKEITYHLCQVIVRDINVL